MSDIRTLWPGPDGSDADWVVVSGDLQQGNDLQTAIYISLFTDRLARDDDPIDGTDRRGWWADTGEEYPIGSRLWLLRRQKLTVQVAGKAEDYCREALQWLLDDKVVSTVSVQSRIAYPRTLLLGIAWQEPGKAMQSVKYSWVWEQ
ncbi:phage GP46 family protein [Enterobacter kobei]|uniref:phage GP46 family protein n=1 Tax=Enterobacter kobei TaxID=208224 RepID=UPI003CECB5CB